VCAALLPGGRVGAVRRLRGGIASGVHAVDLVGPRGERRAVVVRRYGAWRLGRDPRVAEREWATLTALARVGAPAPRPIWLDADGAVFGCPTIVTSRLPGRGLLGPGELATRTGQLASALAQIHAAPLAASELGLLLDQRDDLIALLDRDAPPSELATRPDGAAVWSALRRWWPRVDPPAPTIVHGDYWPGNTLWRYGRLSGVVDWEQVRRGDPAQDVACCRLDLAMLVGPEASAAFLRAYEASAGQTVRRLSSWELYVAAGAIEDVDHWIEGYHDLGRTDVTSELAHARLARFTADALARAAEAESAP
jgi:aminoglycoside phosphotransferase (APT) family kinase protein